MKSADVTGPQNGDAIRTTKILGGQTHEGRVEIAAGTSGLVMYAGDTYLFAKIGAYEWELLPGEYARG